MRSFRPALIKVLLLVVVISLMSTLIASASPITEDNYRPCGAGKIQPGMDGGCCQKPEKPVSFVDYGGCCQNQEPKVANNVVGGGCCQNYGKIASSVDGGGCCQPNKIVNSVAGGGCCQSYKVANSVAGGGGCCQQQEPKIASTADFHGWRENQCCPAQPLKLAVQVTGGKGWQPQPCPSTAAAPTCGLDMPDGSVVGNLASNQQADYAPGLIATGVTVNAGTYWVTGIGKADNGDEYYRIIVACAYLFVPVDTMTPSFQAPWNGEPLPTNEVS